MLKRHLPLLFLLAQEIFMKRFENYGLSYSDWVYFKTNNENKRFRNLVGFFETFKKIVVKLRIS